MSNKKELQQALGVIEQALGELLSYGDTNGTPLGNAVELIEDGMSKFENHIDSLEDELELVVGCVYECIKKTHFILIKQQFDLKVGDKLIYVGICFTSVNYNFDLNGFGLVEIDRSNVNSTNFRKVG